MKWERYYNGILCFALVAMASGRALQFDAGRSATLSFEAGNRIAEWHSASGSATLTPVQGASNGWTHAVLEIGSDGKRSVDFGTVESASPLYVTNADFAAYYAFAIVRCEEPSDLATLIDAPCSTRFAPVLWHDSRWKLSPLQLEETASYAVNGIETNAFTGAESFQLVEVFWDTAVALSEIFIGGSPASPGWKRTWPGTLGELILLEDIPDKEERLALQLYAALKWGIPIEAEIPDAPFILRNLGVSSGNIFTSVIIIR